MRAQAVPSPLARGVVERAWRGYVGAFDGVSAARIAAVAAIGVAICVATGLAHVYAAGFVLVMVPTALVALKSVHRAAVAIALTSPVVALGSINLGFHFLPSYPLIAAGLIGVIWRREWRMLTVRGVDVVLLSFGAIATAVTMSNLGVYPSTTVVGATGANSVHLRPIAQLTALLAMIALYAVIRIGVRRRDDLCAVLRALFVATAFVAVYAAYQVIGRQLDLPYTFVNERRSASTLPVDLGYIRPNSTLTEASTLAQFAFIALFLGVAWLVRRPANEWPRRRTAVFLAAVGSLLVFASLSKAAWVAGGICLPVVVWELTRKRSPTIAACAAAAGAIAATAILRTQAHALDFASLIDSERYVRVGYWIAAVKTAAQHPLGVGVGNFPFYYPQYAPLSPRYEYLSQLADSHNLLLEAAAETGLLGAALLLTFVLVLLISGFQIALTTTETSLRLVALALVGAFATGALMHLTYSYFYFPFEWVLIGTLAAIPQIASSPR
jgi:O-antigen ligase